MTYFIDIFIIILITIFYCIILKNKFEQSLAITFFSIIMILYIFGLCHILSIGVYFIYLLGLPCLIYSSYHLYKDKTILFSSIFTFGALTFLLFSILFFFTTKDRLMSNWDEFSHWGLVVKNMFYLNAFGNAVGATTYFKGYPPAIALLEYFFVKAKGTFCDGYLYRAQNLFSISLLLPIFSAFDWNKFKRIPFLIMIVFSLPIIFYPDFYHSLYVDGILGLLFSYILFLHFTETNYNTQYFFNLGLSSCVLTLTKSSGLGLVIIAFIIILTDTLILKTFSLKNNLKLIIAFPILFVVFGKISWDLYLKATNTSTAWDTTRITLNNIIKIFTPDNPTYRINTISAFFIQMFKFSDGQYAIKMSYILWLLLISIFIIISQHISNTKNEQKSLHIVNYNIIFGFILYSLSLLILYLFTYSEYEAQNIASFDRYLSTYLLGALVFGVLMIISKSSLSLTKFSSEITTAILCVLLLFIPCTSILNDIFLVNYSIQSTQTFRAPYTKSEKFGTMFNIKLDKIYFIAQNTVGWDYWVTRYNATPIQISPPSTWSLGKPYDDKDIWSRQLSVNDWESDLYKNYTYVYLYKVDDRFINDYGSIFSNVKDVKNDTIFKVIKQDNKVILQLATI